MKGSNVTLAKVTGVVRDVEDKHKWVPDVPKDKFCKLLSGMRVEADEIFNEQLLQNEYDAVVMPGGISGVTTFTDNPLFLTFIRTQLKD